MIITLWRGQYLSRRTTVSLDSKAYERLKRHGRFGETFSCLIQRMLDQLEDQEREHE